MFQAFNEIEEQYIEEGAVFQRDQQGRVQTIGKLLREGEQVDRVRRIAADLTPPYLQPEDFRVYVIENSEWNAMAAPNRSIYVFSGLLEDMDDDEVAVVLGHEFVHATHEHSRRQYRRNMIIQDLVQSICSTSQLSQGRESRAVEDLLQPPSWTQMRSSSCCSAWTSRTPFA